MTTNMSAEELAQQIEQLVENFIAGSRAAVTAAVQHAFESAERPRITRSPRRPRRRQMSPRRSPQEMETLSERLYEAVSAKPGETMGVLAPMVGAKARSLQVPANRLKRAGRIRMVGERQLARYFPMLKSSAKSG